MSTSSAHHAQTTSIRVYRSPETTSATLRPRLIALLVGISTYEDRSLMMTQASRDASDFGAVLNAQNGGLYRAVISRMLLDSDATREGIHAGLQWLVREATTEDVAFVFIAGSSHETSARSSYFVPWDGDLRRLTSSAIPLADIVNAVNALPGTVLAFFDVSCSGKSLVASRRAAHAGDVRMYFSSVKQGYAKSNDTAANGPFARAILEAIEGGADYAGTGLISAAMLEQYISQRVSQLTAGMQIPASSRTTTGRDTPILMVNRRGAT